jgi:4-diphosphocytidyl-2-C-methyl-D-erythritol kinase
MREVPAPSLLDLEARAPAKVNLVLRVGPPRADGYHDVDSLLAPLDLCDRVRVRVGPRRGGVRCRTPGRPDLDGPRNLAARAAEAFRRRFDVDRALAIDVEKRIPVTAGLGGGSSDAAAVLRCLARAFGLRDRRALAEVALAVGSDVPFFLMPGAAWAGGRGERLVPASVPTLHLLLAYPTDGALAIRAADAYRWLDEARTGSHEGDRWPRRPGRFRAKMAVNELEGPCASRHPALSTIRGALVSAGALSAIMSGSGPTVFGIYANRSAAGRAAIAVRGACGPGVELFVARTLQRQPGVAPWRSPRSASSPSTRRSSRPT